MSSVKPMLEKTIERKVSEYAKSVGWISYKFTAPARRSVPDRLFISPHGVKIFVEFKRAGSKPTDAQMREHGKLRANKARVYVIDNITDGIALIDSWHRVKVKHVKS